MNADAVRLVRPEAGDNPAFKRVLNLERYLELLDRTEYRRIESGEGEEEIYRLRYRSYLRSHLVEENDEQMIYDEYEDLPNSYRFAVMVDGELVATLRFHHVTAATPWSPAMTAFRNVLGPRVANGETFIDASRFAVSPEWTGSNSPLPAITIRLSFMGCEHFQTPYAINMVRSDHAIYYRRMFGFRQIGKPYQYESTLKSGGKVISEVLLYEGDLRTERNRIYTNFPFYVSTASERRLLFDRPAVGADAPLSVLPTARIALNSAA